LVSLGASSRPAKPSTTKPFAMPEPELGIERVKKPFDNYRIEYGITAVNKDQTRIEFFSGKVKVGHALFGDGFVGVTGVGPGDEIQLWFPITQFASILSLLETQAKLYFSSISILDAPQKSPVRFTAPG
jgi:hypothetical protein